ncbi:hypothetical protein M569_08489, partial [Genlisea aurea]
MGKPAAKKKNQTGSKSNHRHTKQSSKSFDEDTAIFMNMSREVKEEGNKLFQKRDYEGAILKYEKALKLLPANHIDVAYLHNNMAACYMQMGIGEFPVAINECNLALEVAPKYSKALLRRARCYEALNRLDFAVRDVDTVLSMEPNNSNALEFADRIRKGIEEKGVEVARDFMESESERVEEHESEKDVKLETDGKNVREEEEEKIPEDKLVVEEKRSMKDDKLATRLVKLVHGEDIRWAQLPANCGIHVLRDIVVDRFPGLRGVLIKYKDQEGDLVTITTTDELRLAESIADGEAPLRLYVVEVSPDKEPSYGTVKRNGKQKSLQHATDAKNAADDCVEDWIIHFAELFKNYVGFECDSYLDLHEIGMKLYSEAMEDTVTSDDAQALFDIALAKFQEMAALAMFNWGNVHFSKARKRASLNEDAFAESPLSSLKTVYDWAQKEYVEAGMRYKEALKVKPDFYDALIALSLLQFEQAKLSWYHVLGKGRDIDIEQSSHVLELYNGSEDSIERGMQLWEESEERRLNGLSKDEKDEGELAKLGLDGVLRRTPPERALAQAANMRSQIYMLWGTILYERSAMEYKLSLPTWEECLEVAVEKFQLAEASPTDIAVMIKNHCSNVTALQGFKVDEIVQARNEMYDADRWRSCVSSFRLQPLLRRRPPKLLSVLEH